MKTFEEFDNFKDYAKLRSKLKFLIDHLHELTRSETFLEFGDISEQFLISGIFHSPLWSKTNFTEGHLEVKETLNILEELCRIAKIFNAETEISSNGSNYTDFNMIIKYKNLYKGLEDSYIKSLHGIDKYKL